MAQMQVPITVYAVALLLERISDGELFLASNSVVAPGVHPLAEAKAVERAVAEWHESMPEIAAAMRVTSSRVSYVTIEK